MKKKDRELLGLNTLRLKDENAEKSTSRLQNAFGELRTSRHAFRRLTHAVLIELQYKLGLSYLFGLPNYVSLEVTNLCACTCALCPVGQRRQSRDWGRMPFEKYKDVVDQMSSHIRSLNLYNWGDPFLHPAIYEMISYASSKKIYTSLSSTLRDWRVDDADRLVESGLSKLIVSMHGASEETYRDYQPLKSRADLSFSDAIERVKTIALARKRLGSNTPKITLNFIVTRKNEHEMEKFRDLARTLGVKYSFSETSLNLRMLPFDRKMVLRNVDEITLRRERKDACERWLPESKNLINDYYIFVRDNNGELPPIEQKWFGCNRPWKSVVISWNGDVNLCCGSYEVSERVGNVFDEPLRKIWNNPHYRAARNNILGRVSKNGCSVQCEECSGLLL
jgi:MoaA/NifB/PqqE/SkfB family radical SAM enzyme